MRAYFMDLSRLLQDSSATQNYDSNNSTSTPSTDTSQPSHNNDPYEFIAFLLWYMLLVMCCVIPTCCAYRRRRQVEERSTLYNNQPTTAEMAALAMANRFAAHQHQQLQLQHQQQDDQQPRTPGQSLQQQQEAATLASVAFNNGLYLLNGNSSSFPTALRNSEATTGLIDNEQIGTERCRIFVQELKGTTMIMKDEYIEECQPEDIAIHKINYTAVNDARNLLTSSNSNRSVVSAKIDSNNNEDTCGGDINKEEQKTEEEGANNVEKDSNQINKALPDSVVDESGYVLVPVGTSALEHHTTLDEFLFVDGNADDVNSTTLVRLPSGPNGDRKVPCLCAICLCPYDTGDSVSWSPVVNCQHAFHTDCIVEWLVKKQEQGEAKCPLCRQEFCPSATSALNESSVLLAAAAQRQLRQHGQHGGFPYDRHLFERDMQFMSTASFLESFTQALALSQFYRPENSSGTSNQRTVNGTNEGSTGSLSTGRLPVVSILRPEQQTQHRFPILFPYYSYSTHQQQQQRQSPTLSLPSLPQLAVPPPPFSSALDNIETGNNHPSSYNENENENENENRNPLTNTHGVGTSVGSHTRDDESTDEARVGRTITASAATSEVELGNV